MATTLQANPIIIASQSTAAQLTSDMRLLKIRWIGATAVSHVAQVKDRNSNIIWSTTQPSSSIGLVESNFDSFPMNGLFVDDLDSGELHIYVRDNPPFKTT